MSKTFNKKEACKMLLTEDKFIFDIFSIMPLPVRTFAEQDKSLKEELTKEAKTFTTYNGKTNRAHTFEELHAKLEKLKGVKKLDYKQKLFKKKLENRIKKKTKREERLLKRKLARTEQNAAGGKIKIDNDNIPKVPKPKPVFNSEGKMVFSKFDFSEIGVKKKLPKGKNDLNKILQEVQQNKDKMKQLEESGHNEQVIDMKEKAAWKSALAKANGEKIKDNPELLKRTIKRKDQKKKYSAKKWNVRMDNLQKTMQQKQEKRQENIMKRKKQKEQNRLKKAEKKGRVILKETSNS